GGRIINAKTKEMIYDKSLTPEICHELFDVSRELGINIMAYDEESIITTDSDEYIEIESRINDMPIRRVDNFKEAVLANSVKCLATGEPDYIAEIEQKII